MCLHGPVLYSLPAPEHQSPPPYQDSHANGETEQERKREWKMWLNSSQTSDNTHVVGGIHHVTVWAERKNTKAEKKKKKNIN